MTNETGSHENGVTTESDAAIAAISAAEIAAADTTTEAAPAAPTEPAPPSFDDLGLHPDIKLALDDMGYFAPTPVQTAVFKPVSEGKDLLVQSRTGTGKTTAFGLPTINKLVPTHRQPQALILTPTRELALQVARELTNIGKHRGIIIEAIYGGAPIGKQIENLKNGVHIIVGTPGRVLDHIGRRTLDTKAISTFILDECDEMLSMGFLEDIERVVSALPEKKQTLLFSATMPDEVSRYARRHMTAPEQISLSRDQVSVSDIHHAYYIVSGIARTRDLLKILYAEEPESAIIFCNMRGETTAVAKYLQKQGLDAEPLSSDLSQNDRERVMGRMKAKSLRFLCATDVAARGIDISNLSHVINFSVPESPEVYVHRTGRTGRAGKKGTALSMVGPRELGNFRFVRLTFGIKPEERLLPKDDIFAGKLKVPLPPVGTPQPPDPVQILIRGVQNTASELERQIFEKLLSSQSGKRVLAALVAEKLDKLSTKSKPKREHTPREESHVQPEQASEGRSEGRSFDRGEGRSFDRGDRPDRPRFGEGRGEGRSEGRSFDRDRGPGGGEGRSEGRDRGGPGGDRGRERRPWRDRDGERGPAAAPAIDGAPGLPSSAAPGTDAPRGDRPERSDRPERDRGDRGGRFERDRGERRFDRDRPERSDRSDRSDRPERTDGDVTAAPAAATAPVAGASTDEARTDRPDRDRGERRFDRDRGERGERGGRFRDRERGDRDRGGDRDRPRDQDRVEAKPEVAPVGQDPTAEAEVAVDTAPAIGEAAPTEQRTDRGERSDRGERGRDRGGRGRDRGRDRDRDRGRSDVTAEAPVAAVGTEAAPAVETAEVPTKVDEVARAAIERADRGGKGPKKKAEATSDTREFWETWAEEKTTREPAPAAAASEPAAADDDGERRPARSRGGRDRGRDKGRAKPEGKAEAKPDAKAEGKADKAEPKAAAKPAVKRDVVTTSDAQARLFISLGKKHGVSADDLRALLAAPIGGDKERIGSVSLRDSHAHVRVPEDIVEQIIAGVHGTTHNEHDITVERARA